MIIILIHGMNVPYSTCFLITIFFFFIRSPSSRFTTRSTYLRAHTRTCRDCRLFSYFLYLRPTYQHRTIKYVQTYTLQLHSCQNVKYKFDYNALVGWCRPPGGGYKYCVVFRYQSQLLTVEYHESPMITQTNATLT